MKRDVGTVEISRNKNHTNQRKTSPVCFLQRCWVSAGHSHHRKTRIGLDICENWVANFRRFGECKMPMQQHTNSRIRYAKTCRWFSIDEFAKSTFIISELSFGLLKLKGFPHPKNSASQMSDAMPRNTTVWLALSGNPSNVPCMSRVIKQRPSLWQKRHTE